MSCDTTVILSAGQINYSNLPIGTNVSNSTIPVNGKPVIGWIIDDLLKKEIFDIVVVVRHEDEKIQKILSRAYSARCNLTIIPLEQPTTILHSLLAGLNAASCDGLVRIILGDTLIRDPFNCENDFVYVGTVDDAKRWCLAITNENGEIQDFLDKEDHQNLTHQALAGYYHILDGKLLKEVAEKCVCEGRKELSAALKEYMNYRFIQAKPVKDWYDFGHIDNLISAKQRLLRPRYFNSLKINPVLNTITKLSENNSKLRDELDWYFDIPDELKVLTPRIISYKKHHDKAEIVQEYYGYPTLAELYLYGELHHENWMSIIKHIFQIHEEFKNYKSEMPSEILDEVYISKTKERLEILKTENNEWEVLLNKEYVLYNDEVLVGLLGLNEMIERKIGEMKVSFSPCIIHGDLCFSNMLYDISNQIIRLIDPRGSFGKKGIYGDPRYDIAKLRHSVVGLYDYIIADMFEIYQKTDKFFGQIFDSPSLIEIEREFDKQIVLHGYDLDEIKLIEGLLFVSMIPLHKDYPRRQKMMFLTGLKRLNEVYKSKKV